jgi:hypothetical protein
MPLLILNARPVSPEQEAGEDGGQPFMERIHGTRYYG